MEKWVTRLEMGATIHDWKQVNTLLFVHTTFDGDAKEWYLAEVAPLQPCANARTALFEKCSNRRTLLQLCTAVRGWTGTEIH